MFVRLLHCVVILCLSFLSFNAHSVPCESPNYRQFDFWLGKWEVIAGGKVVGTNTITRHLGKCVIYEHYVSRSGYEGTSYNIYDARHDQWFQFWVDNSGLRLHLAGEFEGKRMILKGERKGKDGRAIVDKISWTEEAQGRVRQIWQTSEDGGKTWKISFDGIYRAID